MRPGQNKRMRGRNNNGGGSGGGGNNRKGPNPLTRSYESNGPDVKIRGTAHHIGEKYLQLARDAQSSGDPVMAESYLQHAEHYFRLIASAQQAQQQAAYGYQRPAGEPVESDDGDDDDDFSSLPDRFASPVEKVAPPPTPQPYAERQSYNGGGERGPYEPRHDRERPDRERYDRANQGANGERQGQDRQSQDRQPQDRPSQDRQPQDRQPHQERPYADRQSQGEGRYENRQDRNRGERQPYGDRSAPRQERPPYQERPAPEAAAADRNGPTRDYDNRGARNNRRDFREQRQPEVEPATVGALPAFITAPVRIAPEPAPVGEPTAASPGTEAPPSMAEGSHGEDAGFALRPRRRRRTKAEFMEAGGEPQGAPASDPVGE